MPSSAPLEFPQPDDSLVAPLRAGDEAAWRRAYAELWPVAWRAAQAVLRSPHESEDAAMRALEKLHAHRERPRNWNDFLAMAAVIARREAITTVRARATAKRGGDQVVSLDELSFEPADVPATIALGLDLSEMLASLTPEVRHIVEAHFVEGRSSQEIAAATGKNANTIRSQLMRALQALRKLAAGADAASKAEGKPGT